MRGEYSVRGLLERNGFVDGPRGRWPVRPGVGLGRRGLATHLWWQRQAGQYEPDPVVEAVPSVLEGSVVQHHQRQALRSELRVWSQRVALFHQDLRQGPDLVVSAL